MKDRKPVLAQCSQCLPFLLTAYIIAAVLFVVVTYFGSRHNLPPRFFTADPATMLRTAWSVGFFSSLGILLWGATATICLYSFSILRSTPLGKEWGFFFLVSGIFNFTLLFDDLFLFHERWLKRFIPGSIPEEALYLLYAGLVVLFLFRFKDRILESDYIVLIASLGFFALSIGMDQWPAQSQFLMFLEDVPKFFGLIGWCFYFTKLSLNIVGRVIQFK